MTQRGDSSRVAQRRRWSVFSSEVAPGLWEAADAEGPADLLRGHADGLGEGGEGELEFGDLLDGHSGGHACGDRLHGLGRVLTEHVSAEDGVIPAVRDQLAKAVRAAVGDGPEQVIVAGDTDDHIVLLRGLGLGEAHPSVSGSVKLPLGTTS